MKNHTKTLLIAGAVGAAIMAIGGLFFGSDSGVGGATLLSVPQGGTFAASFTDAGVIIGNGTGALQVTTAGTSGEVLTSNGAGVDPTFQAAAAGDPFAWTVTTDGVATTTLLEMQAGLISTGSTTLNGKLTVTDDAIFSAIVDADHFVATSTTATTTFAGGLAIETSGLVYDFSTNFVGIGTAQPAAQFHLVDTEGTLPTLLSPTNMILQNNSAAGASARFAIIGGTSGRSEVMFGDSGDIDVGSILYRHLGNSLEFIVASSTRMFIDSSGNVGIATTSPEEKLDVNGAIVAGNSLGGAFGTVGTDGYQIRNGGGIRRTVLMMDTNGEVFFGNPEAKTLHIRTNDVDRITVLSGGNVGISSTTPSTLLSVGNTSGINFTTATSTWNSSGGINLESGCFSILGICIGGAAGGAWTSSGGLTTMDTPADTLVIASTTAYGSVGAFASTTLLAAQGFEADGTTPTLDFNKYNGSNVTLTGNANIQFTGGKAGQAVYVETCQDATGNRDIITWDDDILWENNATSSQNLTADTCTTFNFRIQHGTSTPHFLFTGSTQTP